MRGGMVRLFGETQEQPTPRPYVSLEEDQRSEELEAALHAHRAALRLAGRVGRPPKGYHRPTNRREGWETFCNRARVEYLKKLRVISLQRTITLREVLDQALEAYINAYESEHGPIDPEAAPREI